MRKIVFTGGGTAGHVTPNLAIISKLKLEGWDIHYIGSVQGIEKKIVEQAEIPFYAISSGKLRRYLDVKNITDPFRVMKGMLDSIKWLRKIKPNLVFSKGGFVTVPVVIASWLCRIPVIIHESDMTPGLANRIASPFATKVCVTFPETLKHINIKKAIWTGLPIREQLAQGEKEIGLAACQFTSSKPVILVMGGSLGSQTINLAIREAIDPLLKKFQILHICGKGNVNQKLQSTKGYQQFEFVDELLPHLFAMSDIVVSRAGSTSIFECLTLQKPMLLIPLSLDASRGDQLLNAQSFQTAGYADVLFEQDLTSIRIINCIEQLYANREKFRSTMSKGNQHVAIEHIIQLIQQVASK